jgi:hypothetical protein
MLFYCICNIKSQINSLEEREREREVTSTPIGTLKKVIEHVLPILKAKGNKPCIIVPPLPRYLFLRCCNDKGHCTNANENDFPEKLLSGFIQQRNELTRSLVQTGLTNFKVLDACCVTNCTTTASIPDMLKELRKVASEDGVHFNGQGYMNLAQRTVSCLKTILTEKPKCVRKHTFFWRGYRSVHGSMATRATHSTTNRGGGVALLVVSETAERGVSKLADALVSSTHILGGKNDCYYGET